MAEQLKPCPFCGEPAEERAEEHESRGWFACSNNECPAWHMQAEINDWNRRAASATPSEDGREAFIRRMIEERDLSRTMAAHMWDNQQPKKQPRLVECDACPTSGGCVEVCMKAPAQPGRQVGGDERERFIKWANKEYGIEDGYELNLSNRDLLENQKGWMARAALAPAAVVTDHGAEGSAAQKAFWSGFAGAYMSQSGNIREAWNHYKETDEFARLNRRAIPAGLIEKAANLLDAHMCTGCAGSEICCRPEVRDTARELRALLGKDGEA